MKKSQTISLITCIIFLCILITSNHSFADKVKIKFASLAPEGTTWANILEEAAKEIKKKTKKRVKVKYYLGGKKGEEPEMIQKMKIGEIDAVGVSGMGLQSIVKDIRVMDLPLLFETYTEFDYLRCNLFQTFAEKFLEADYVLLAMNETGFVYNFSNIPIKEIADVKKVKTWIYKGEPISMTLADIIGINTVPLGITDVLTSLQTGLIESCYAPPVAAIAFQWHTKVKYISSKPLTNGCGGIVIRKSTFDKMIPKDQKILKAILKEKNEKTIIEMRKDNEMAKEDLTSRFGLTECSLSKKADNEMKTIAEKVRKRLVGEYYSQELLDKTISLVKECRDMGQEKCRQVIQKLMAEAQ
ncbi:Extracellular solute-binding protein, family 7, bacteria [Candidatus Magnetomorum sp. HK-1]|nr:Extracellular solute-binding protein, family 7, bacteria [Candidatus Magnetomorum sp. HK-1]